MKWSCGFEKHLIWEIYIVNFPSRPRYHSHSAGDTFRCLKKKKPRQEGVEEITFNNPAGADLGYFFE